MKLIKPYFEIEDEINREELLKKIEKAGRTCYKSEDRITEDSSKKFIEMILNKGHETVIEHEKVTVRVICDRGCCYSNDTYVLTENGWKLFKDVTSNERIYTLDDDNNLILIEYLTKHKYQYSRNLYNFRTTQIDLLITPNHNCWVFDYHKRSNKTKKWKFLEAQEMKNNRYKFAKSCNKYNIKAINHILIPKVSIKRGIYNKEYPKLSFNSLKFLKLLGLWVTDGSISAGKGTSGNRIVISQKKQKGRNVIEKLLQQLNILYTAYKAEFRLNCPQLYHWLKNNFIIGNNYRKTYYLNLPIWLRNNLSTKEIKSFLEGIILGDGSKLKDGRICIYSASEAFAKNLVELFLKIGKCANIHVVNRHKKRTDGLKIYSKVPQYVIQVLQKKDTLFNKSNKTFSDSIKYKGQVYCLELPKYHKLYVMRNGKACWCGNSHEIVRHRLFSYSQESTRYCNYSGGVTFIIPPWVKRLNEGEYLFYEDAPGIISEYNRIWFNHMLDCEQKYLTLLKAEWSPQQARSVLPNSLKTEIVMTANLREWKHFFKLRTSAKAHPQMQEIARPLLDEFKNLIPIIFDDINYEDTKN